MYRRGGVIVSRKKQKILLTVLLRNSIKDLRKKYGKRGDDLSKELQKGASYISQLENGKIREIDFDLLIDIFQRITGLSGANFNAFILEFINNILHNIQKKDLLNEVWIHLFIMQEIQYPITSTILNIINDNLLKYNCSPEHLIKLTNCTKGNDIRPDFAYESNKLYVSVTKSSGYENDTDYEYDIYTDIEYRLPSSFASQILSQEITDISYINLHGLMYNLFLLKDKHDLNGALIKTEEFLRDNDFFTAIELYDNFHENSKKDSDLTTNNLFSHYDDLIVNYTTRFQKLKKEVLNQIEYALDNYYHYGKEATNLYKMEEMRKNVDTNTTYGDLGLIMSILSSPIYDIDIYDRDDFWIKYKELINTFLKHNNSQQ